MIPTNKQLRKVSTNLIFEDEDYFSLCYEYSELEKIFIGDLFNSLSLFMDMILYPIYMIYQLCTMNISPLDILSVMKCYELWKQWIRYENLKTKLFEWKLIVRSLGGPWISSSDPSYHSLVYADGMTRISESRKKSKSV
jgi:hypothetical protein